MAPVGKGLLGRARAMLRMGPAVLSQPILADMRLITVLLARPDRLERMTRMSVVLLAVIAVLATLELASGFLMPTVFAIVLAFMILPLARLLERLPFGRYFAAAVSVLTLIGGLFVGALLALPAVEGWVDRLPEVTRLLEQEIDAIRSTLAAVETASQDVQESVSGEAEGEQSQQTVTVKEESVVSQAAVLAPGVLAQIGYVAFLVVFLLAERGSIRGMVLRAPADFVTRLKLARVVRHMGSSVSDYLFIISCVNLGLAAITTVTLLALRVPDAFLWGAGVGIFNFVPYIGPLVIQAIIFVVGLLTFGTVENAVIAPAILLVVHILESNVVTPMLVGRRVVFNPLAIFVAVAFGAWIWGVGGAIVAVPLLIIVWTVLRGVYETQAAKPQPTISNPVASSPAAIGTVTAALSHAEPSTI